MVPSSRICTSCDTPLPPEAKFCLNCGTATPTEAGAPPSSITPSEAQLERLKSALADRYRIERLLGYGGMATVYLAEDLRHHRKVAIKVLRPELAATLGAERFVREIEIAANLTHPHILPLHDSGEADGFLYYVMPFVEGESLRDRMSREGQLPLNDAVQIARDIAAALSYAHSQGVVHRDIKPENVLLSAGLAVVADFGIARAITEAGGEHLTETGISIGTPPYMSPEQASGAQQLDGRSDVYSLGCVLYEMLAGEPPFTAPTAQALVAKKLGEPTPRISVIRELLPAGIEAALTKALAKSPADRFQTAGDLTATLGRIDTSAVTPGRSSASTAFSLLSARGSAGVIRVGVAALIIGLVGLAGWKLWLGSEGGTSVAEADLIPNSVSVLYFDDLTPDNELGYLADGLTEGLIDQLTRVPTLHVISRHGAARYRNSQLAPDSIARALRVSSLVKGSVESAGDRIRITTRLVDGRSGADFARTTFELPVGAVFEMQDSLVEAVSAFLRRRLGDEVRRQERLAQTSSPEAWSLVQRSERLRKDGLRLIRADSASEGFALLDLADSTARRAEDADPAWVEPVVLRADIAYQRSRTADDLAKLFDWIRVGLRHANRALDLDPNHAPALATRGTLRYWGLINDFEPDPNAALSLLANAQADLERAVEIDPGLARAFAVLSHLYYRTDDGIIAVILAARSALEADVYLEDSETVLSRLFYAHYDSEQFVQARRWCDEGNRRFPDDYRFKECQLFVMTTSAATPDPDEAWRLWTELVQLIPAPERDYQSRWSKMIVGGVLARAGLDDSARVVLLSARPEPAADPLQELSWLEAYMRVLLGDFDEAIELLKRFLAVNPREQPKGDYKVYWHWRDLIGHPRVSEVLPALVI